MVNNSSILRDLKMALGNIFGKAAQINQTGANRQPNSTQ